MAWKRRDVYDGEHRFVDTLCFVLPQYWGDHFVSPLRDLLEQACKERDVADCEFFINKRDYPQLKFNPDTLKPVEPYGFIYDKDDR